MNTARRWTHTLKSCARAPRLREWIIACWSPTGRSMPRSPNIFRSGKGETDGVSQPMVSRRGGRAGRAALLAPAAPTHVDAAAFQLADVFRAADAKLDPAPAAALSGAAGFAASAARIAGARVFRPIHQPARGGHEERQADDGGGRQFFQYARQDACRRLKTR